MPSATTEICPKWIKLPAGFLIRNGWKFLIFLVLKQSILSNSSALQLHRKQSQPNIQCFVTFVFSFTKRPLHKMYHKNKSWVLVGVFWESLSGGWCGVFLVGVGRNLFS